MFRKSRHLSLATIAVGAIVLLWSSSADAAVKRWAGGTTTWSSGTWSPAGAPGASDIAYFDGTSQNNCNIAANISVAGIVVASSYTGTITVASGVTATVTNMGVTDGLVGYWRFDETSGTVAYDHSGFATDLTYLASFNPTPSTSKPTTSFIDDRSLAFTLGDALVKTNYPAQLESSDWTISAWITKSASYGANDCGLGAGIHGSEILNLGDDLGLRICANGKARVYKATGVGTYGSCASSNTLTTGTTWHHVAATNSGTTLTLYLNGVKTTCTGTGTQAYPNGTTLRVGKHATGNQYDYDGNMDELRWYDRALSDDEIAALRAGDHPPAVNTVQNVGGAGSFDVSNHFILNGQLAALGNFNVAGSFFNFNSTTTGTTAITLDGSGTGAVGGFGGFVHALTLAGSATRTLADRLVVKGALTISSATDISNRTVYAGTINHTGGTLTTTGSTVVVDHGAAQTLRVTTSALNTLRVGDASRTGLIGYWKFDETSGTSAADSSGTGNTGTAGGSPTWNAAAATDITFTNPRSLQFDGVDDVVSLPYPTHYAPVTISAWIYVTDVGDSTGPRIMQFPYMDFSLRLNAPNTDRLNFDVTAPTHYTWMSEKTYRRNAWQHVAVTWSGSVATAPTFYINGIAQNTLVYQAGSGSAQTGTGTAYIGNNSALDRSFEGRMDDVRLYNVVLTEEQILALASGKGQSATFTLGANLSASGAVTIDKGTLATSTYSLTSGTSGSAGTILTVMDDGTLTTGSAACSLNGGLSVNTGGTVTTGAGTVTLGHDGTETLNVDGAVTLGGSLNIGARAAHVDSGGSFTIGPGTVTATENLTVNAGGTLQMSSTTGTAPTISMASGKTLLVNGTLRTTIAAAAAKSIIRATGATSTFIFNVSTVAAGTAILDIDGLAIQNTTSPGLYINSNATAATTFTSFKNIDFSHPYAAGGPYAYLLQIDADSLSATFDDLTFDTTNTTYNFRLKDRNGGTNTRVFVGATCTGDADCEANDHDGDNGVVAPINNNIADDAMNSAIIFWGERAHSDTAGAVVGFPVAAYDWNDFSFRANYVSFNNAHSNGTGDILYVRDEDGSPQYSWNLPANAGNSNGFVGAPRWTEEGGLHYLYVVDSDGNVYKLLDNGSTLALAGSPWNTPYRYTTDGTATTASSPLTIHGSYLYWYGYSGAGASSPRMFRLGMDKSVPASPHALGSGDLLYTAPAVDSVAGEAFVFGATTKNGSNAKVYKIATDFSPVSSATLPKATVNSRVAALGGKVFMVDETGKAWCLNASDLTSSWAFRDGTANHAPACADSGGAPGCLAKNFLVDPAGQYVYYGDADGHVYCANSTAGGSACTNYTNFRPGSAADVFETAPLLREGVLVIGAVNGNVYFIDRSAGTVFRKYELGAPVSSISYTFDRTDSASGAFTIATGTPPGRLYQIRRTYVIDPTLGTP